jgi:glycosyltransferase involved in cell wall biosynthesis
LFNQVYYSLRPFIPRRVLVALRRSSIKRRRECYQDIWPINKKAGAHPLGWTGWPDGKQFALILTHDVETAKGQQRCLDLMQVEERLGFQSSFNFVPERYTILPEVLQQLRDKNYEIGVHGLNHDGRLFRSKEQFQLRALRINQYLKKWDAVGFRSPSMHHNLKWISQLDIEYDASTTDTDPFEPQPCCLGTIFPCLIAGKSIQNTYVELPYTLSQDFTLFILMLEKNIDIWKAKLDWIAECGGMVLLNTHPDYMNFTSHTSHSYEYPFQYYEEILKYIKDKYEGEYWDVLPRDMARFWLQASARMTGGGKRNIAKENLCPSCLNIWSDVGDSNDVSPHIPKRICMLAYNFYDYDNRVKRYAETLAQRGDYVDVIVLRQEGFASYEKVKGVNVYRIQKRIRNEKWQLSYLYRLLLYMFNSTVLLTRKHLREPYDVIHVHSVPDFEVFAAIFAKFLGAKIILDIHDIVPEYYASKFNVSRSSFLYRALIAIEKISIAFSDHVIIANHLWREKLISRSVKEDKCSVILNYPDQNIFFRRPKSVVDSKFIMLYPGTLGKHQGLDVAIRALAIVKDEVPELELHIHGGGAETANLKNLCKKMRLENRVLFKPFLPMEQIAETMANADLGIVPKRRDSFGDEAFSTKILEFMALGIPLVVADTKIDRYYFDESMIQYFRAGDANDLAKCLVMIIDDSEARKRLVENGLKYIEENNWDMHKSSYFELINKLLKH